MWLFDFSNFGWQLFRNKVDFCKYVDLVSYEFLNLICKFHSSEISWNFFYDPTYYLSCWIFSVGVGYSVLQRLINKQWIIFLFFLTLVYPWWLLSFLILLITETMVVNFSDAKCLFVCLFLPLLPCDFVSFILNLYVWMNSC